MPQWTTQQAAQVQHHRALISPQTLSGSSHQVTAKVSIKCCSMSCAAITHRCPQMSCGAWQNTLAQVLQARSATRQLAALFGMPLSCGYSAERRAARVPQNRFQIGRSSIFAQHGDAPPGGTNAQSDLTDPRETYMGVRET